jgi:hypothetical protein
MKQRELSYQKVTFLCHGIVDNLLTWCVIVTHALTLETRILIHIYGICWLFFFIEVFKQNVLHGI